MNSRRFGSSISDSHCVPEPLRVAIGGLGAIGFRVARRLDEGVPGLILQSVSAHNVERAKERVAEFKGSPSIKSLSELAEEADVVVECTPPERFREIAEPALRQGRIFMPLSVGQLILNSDFFEMAESTGARIVVPSGAMLGLDALRAASEGTIHSVRLVTRKPIASLLGAPWLKERGIDLSAHKEPVKVFEGDAFEAAAAFPANINVGAALSLAGIGPADTAIEIWADPTLERNTHQITVKADSANFVMSIQSVPTLDNPATGELTPLSVINSLRNLVATVRVGS